MCVCALLCSKRPPNNIQTKWNKWNRVTQIARIVLCRAVFFFHFSFFYSLLSCWRACYGNNIEGEQRWKTLPILTKLYHNKAQSSLLSLALALSLSAHSKCFCSHIMSVYGYNAECIVSYLFGKRVFIAFNAFRVFDYCFHKLLAHHSKLIHMEIFR